MPTGSIGKRKNKLGWGIIIGNGEQTVDILSSKSNLDHKDFIEKDLIQMDEIDVRPELWQLFPEARFAHPDAGGNEKLNCSTYKKLKKDNEVYNLRRYLVAEDFQHLNLIIRDYFQENEAKICNSANCNLSDWVEIIGGQDGNMYLYVGEKNASGGREIKVGINKEEFEKENVPVKGRLKSKLEIRWDLLVLSSKLSRPEDKEKYYQVLEETFQEQWPHREKLCRQYWEDVAEKMEEKANYWTEKSRQSGYQDKKSEEACVLATSRFTKIKAELERNKNIKTCSDECRFLHDPSLPKKDNPTPTSPTSSKTNGAGKTSNNKNNQLKDSEKSQILSYFINKNISKISLDNGKLVIEYKNNTKKTVENEDQELTKYHQLIENLPNKSLSLSELENNNTNNPSTPNKSNIAIYISLAVGAFILGGIFVYFLARKKKK